MKEYIERETCLKEFKEVKPANWDNTEYEKQAVTDYNFYRSIVENAPAADVELVQHGKWIDTDTFDFHCVHIYQCSNCSKEVADDYINNHKFCLHCGAKMDGGNK